MFTCFYLYHKDIFLVNRHEQVLGFLTEKQQGTQVKSYYQPYLIAYLVLLVGNLINSNPNPWSFREVFISYYLFVQQKLNLVGHLGGNNRRALVKSGPFITLVVVSQCSRFVKSSLKFSTFQNLYQTALFQYI